ncbi:MAG: outer membrane beta-barrel protein [Thermodesulfobacteriota bacterium]
MSKGFVKVALIAVLAAVLSMPWSAEAEEGLLGVEFVFTVGAQVGPFDTDTGVFVAGEIGIPIAQAGPGVFMGLLNIGWSQTDDDLIFEPTINAVAPGALPVQTNVDLTTLTILFGLKYKLNASPIVQPYVFVGPGFTLFFNQSDPGELVGGIAPQPEILRNQGFPSGQGNVEIGVHAGGGVDLNITSQVFIGGEGRFNWVDRDNGAWVTFGGRAGFRF